VTLQRPSQSTLPIVQPVVLPADTMLSPRGKPAPLKQGFLLKMGNNMIKDWKKRWVVMESDTLYYYRSRTVRHWLHLQHKKLYSCLMQAYVCDASSFVVFLQDQAPAGSIKFITCHVTNNDSVGKPHCLEIVTPTRSYFFSAESQAERQEWMAAIVAANERLLHNFFDSQSSTASVSSSGGGATTSSSAVRSFHHIT